MGTFAGHAMPGTFFLMFGVRWSHAALRRFLSGASSVDRSPTANNAEAWLKLLLCVIGVGGEFTTPYVGDNNIHHMLMYAAYGLNAGIELTTDSMPDHAYGASLLLALGVQALLTATHTHGRDPLDVRVHQLLLLSNCVTLVAVVIEMWRRQHVTSSLFRSMAFSAQGTWLIHAGFILYNPIPGAIPWKPNDHVQLMNISSLFVSHLLAHVALVFGIALVTPRPGRRVKRVSFAEIPLSVKADS